MSPAPLIIWTLRRTGGTTLGSALFDRLPFRKIEHEPFNTDRALGHITRAWIENADAVELARALNEVARQGLLIKHCVELMSPSFNEALARATTEAGYHHLFLYRRQALGRLLSLWFAQRSGVWGRQRGGGSVPGEGVFDEPLPVSRIVAHEKSCRGQLRSLYRLLKSLGAEPRQVAFEDLYVDPDATRRQQRLRAVLDGFGMETDEEGFSAFLARVSGGEQGTRGEYSRFVNIDELQEALDALGDFDPAEAAVQCTLADLPESPLTLFRLWPPQRLKGGDWEIGGLILSRDPAGSLCLRVEGVEYPVQRGLASPSFARRSPGVPGAGKARFLLRGVVLGEQGAARLVWRSAQGEAIELATISRGEDGAGGTDETAFDVEV